MPAMYSPLTAPKTGTWASFSRRRLTNAPALTRFCFLSGVFTLLCSSLLLFRSSVPTSHLIPPSLSSPFGKPPPQSHLLDFLANSTSEYASHPIDERIADARRTHEALLAQRSTDLQSASARYRIRRGRHPPPGFDKWTEYALKHDAVIVESFFDRIYSDLQPFWALDSWQTAKRAAEWPHVVRVRGGKATAVGDVSDKVPWLQLWTNLVAEAAEFLPDVDMPINYMDESRLLVPYEDVNRMVEQARMWRKVMPVDTVVREFHGLKSYHNNGEDPIPYEPAWITDDLQRYWEYVRLTCPPDAPSRNATALMDFSLLPAFPEDWEPDYSQNGYVKNHTAAMDPCYQPHLRSLHSTFVEPVSMKSSQELIPLFGGSKLSRNNEILIPGAMYLTDDTFYSGGAWHGPPWEQKTSSVVWRGVASGGRHHENNWMHFQRLRLIEMLNGTTVTRLEQNEARAMTFEMPPVYQYDYPRRREGKVGDWLTGHSDAGFVELLCFPFDSCGYLNEYFHEVEKKPMDQQYVHKFMPDVDGNSFSARYRGLLLSTSLPIKATIYAEWHDDRLQPWLHFVPMDNTLQDLYGILDYFTRDAKGDAAAKMIAETGKSWGEKVLRREDMVLYVWRLLLEFARVCDENRDRLGWVDDLMPSGV
ncbi:unnamed protein product [Discula destructiva]